MYLLRKATKKLRMLVGYMYLGDIMPELTWVNSMSGCEVNLPIWNAELWRRRPGIRERRSAIVCYPRLYHTVCR